MSKRMSSQMGKLRILCLHGYHGSALILRAQMGGWQAGLEDLAEFVHVDAPSLAEGDFGWWHAAPPRYRGWERTRAALAELTSRQGPFDGVFGFSQGAAVAALYAGQVRFAIMVGGFATTAPEHAAHYQRLLTAGVPSLHIIGRSDGIVPMRRSHELAARFAAPWVVEHDGGHVVAATAAVRAASREFLAAMAAHKALVMAHGATAKPSSRAPALVATTAALVAMAATAGAMHAAPKTPATNATTATSSRPHLPMTNEAPSPAPTALTALTALTAPTALTLPLWPEAPGRPAKELRVYLPSSSASSTSEPPAAALRPAMIVLRGGGYAISSGSGAGAAEWAARHGMVGVEVDYGTRSSGEAYPQGYADAARAVRMVRSRAAEWAIDPGRVGVMGFSAGGHLASLLSTQPTLHVDARDELAPRLSARPDLVVLAYPVISFVEGYHPGAFVSSVESFFGEAVDVSDLALRRRFSSELHVTADHPPVFLWTTRDDALVPASHSERFAEACRRAGVAIDFTMYPTGRHGLGLARGEAGPLGQWTERLLEWLPRHWRQRG